MYIKLYLILILSSIFLLTCASKPIDGPLFREGGQAITVDLNQYTSAQLRKGPQNNQIIVAAAISGGGHRAANFGAGVLLALERIEVGNSNVLQEIDYFSTVSGGGFAAGSYLSTLHDYINIEGVDGINEFRYADYFKPSEQPVSKEIKSYCRESCTNYTKNKMTQCVRRNIERGYRQPLFSVLASPTAWFTDLDRGDFLEEKIDLRLLGSCWREREGTNSLTMGDIFHLDKSKSPPLPYWITNATIFDNGAIFPFTPDVLNEYCINGYIHNKKKHYVGQNNGESCNEDINDYLTFPLSVGVKASASFPGVVAATTISSSFHNNPNVYIRLMDGGLSDNLGILTAVDLLIQDEGMDKNSKPKKVLIVIDAYKENYEPFSTASGSPYLLQVSNRLYGISLDSWRSRHVGILNKLSTTKDENISLIFLNFDIVKDSSVSFNEFECNKWTNEQLADHAKKVATDFELNDEEQLKLLCAGYVAVKTKEAEIVKEIYN